MVVGGLLGLLACSPPGSEEPGRSPMTGDGVWGCEAGEQAQGRTTGYVRLRLLPTVEAEALTTLSPATTVLVSETTDQGGRYGNGRRDWLHVQLGVYDGWIAGEYAVRVGCVGADGALDLPPFKLTGSFDGSQGFKMWLRSLNLARDIRAQSGREAHFTYFINGVYYYIDECLQMVGSQCMARQTFPPMPDEDGDNLPDVRLDPPHSDFGIARSREEVLARFAITQQAINEGHDIGTHSMFHDHMGDWSYAQLNRDFAQMDALVGSMLFEPVSTGPQSWAFPRWVARSSTPGATGAPCDPDAPQAGGCAGGVCLTVAPGHSYCSQTCNAEAPCPANLACGGPEWSGARFQDVCVPLPELPVVHQGRQLFRSDGTPDPQALADGLLRRYRMAGFRAPYLAINESLLSVMADRGYRYDASEPRPVEAPHRRWVGGHGYSLWRFGIMSANPGGGSTYDWPMPFDSVYADFGLGTNVMRAQYRDSILRLYRERDVTPAWNIGSHFSYWTTDAAGVSYYQIFDETLRWAGAGCPDQSGTAQCPDLQLVSFSQLADALEAVE